jgi:hypothetical protein
MEVCCEHRDEPSASIRCKEILMYLSDLQLLKKDIAPWSYLIS